MPTRSTPEGLSCKSIQTAPETTNASTIHEIQMCCFSASRAVRTMPQLGYRRGRWEYEVRNIRGCLAQGIGHRKNLFRPRLSSLGKPDRPIPPNQIDRPLHHQPVGPVELRHFPVA